MSFKTFTSISQHIKIPNDTTNPAKFQIKFLKSEHENYLTEKIYKIVLAVMKQSALPEEKKHTIV